MGLETESRLEVVFLNESNISTAGPYVNPLVSVATPTFRSLATVDRGTQKSEGRTRDRPRSGNLGEEESTDSLRETHCFLQSDTVKREGEDGVFRYKG